MKNKGRNAQQEPAFTGPGVSELLKTTRERAGIDLQVVAQVLRIRYIYLEAIEDGRYQDLPGKTYVLGFVRAYSEHLGLDSEEVVKRFKHEVAGLEGRSELMFPSPVTEQSVPGGAIIMIGLVVLAAAYGGWYFMSSQDRDVAELVPDLPAKFSEMIDRVKNGNKADEAGASQTAQAPQPEEQKTQAEPAATPASQPVSEADTQDMAQKAMAALEKAKSEEKEVEQVVETVKLETREAVEPVQETDAAPSEASQAQAEPEKKEEAPAQVAEPEKQEEPAPAVEQVAAEPVKVEETSQAEKKVEEVTPAVEEKTEAVVAAAEVEEPKKEEEVKPVAQPMNEKVVLKAVDYSWIQLTNDSGSVLHTQVLNEGEEYQIPQTSGLILRTGNAGGLEIYVDGKKAPSIGAAGEVRRKVLMNPEKLLAGKAVES